MSSHLSAFSGYGVELEYMIVAADTLAVTPLADKLLAKAGGREGISDYEDGPIAWSNELVNHVIELKTNGPAKSLVGLEEEFASSLSHIEEILQPWNARLMPTAMHPWMNPLWETQLWPHDNSEIYQLFDKIFNTRGHGWSNLQSVHLNLPFGTDEEFGRLHAAIRLILPILPALAASSPLVEGKLTGLLDNRLEVYRRNCASIPLVTAQVIPEQVFTQADYQETIFEPMFQAIAPHDPEEILREEWLNARGAIARFGRGTIEIRVLDIQECPRADLAISRLICAVLQGLVSERWSSFADQKSWQVAPLYQLLLDCIKNGEQTQITEPTYLRAFGMKGSAHCRAADMWRHLAFATDQHGDSALRTILDQGTLSRRIIQALGGDDGPANLVQVYGKLCQCLRENRLFTL